jgi:hypothetical protein
MIALGTTLAREAAAQLVQGADLTTNDYNIDLYQGPVLASTRVIGLAGAYVAIAEGTDGLNQNPASPAVRVPYSFDHFDFDLGLGLSYPSVLRNTDFFNTGEDRAEVIATRDQDILFLNLAGSFQFGSWGFGLSTELQQYPGGGLRPTGARGRSRAPPRPGGPPGSRRSPSGGRRTPPR